MLSFITVCRSRLHHLKLSLPKMVAQPGASVFVVDYGCPDGTGDWVRANFPQVTVVAPQDAHKFELARARNLGAAAAIAAGGEWLCFIDADTLIAPDYTSTVMPFLERGGFYRPKSGIGDSVGMCICHRDDFKKVGGYDEVLQGWGMEDRDLYTRFLIDGLARRRFPGHAFEMIRHSVDLRVQHYAIKTPELSSTLNLVYCTAKWDLMRLELAKLSLPRRKALYRQVSQLVLDAHEKKAPLVMRLAVSSKKSVTGVTLTSQLVYRMERTTDESGEPLIADSGHIRGYGDDDFITAGEGVEAADRA
ncbi:MAG: galactosyltransferase-related protein [Pseudomonadota bacterium]